MIMKNYTCSHIIKLKLAVMALLLAPLLISCGIYYTVEGNVIDAKTGKPVQGAVVSVNWQRAELGVPGLTATYHEYGVFESITDADGTFKIPKYLIGRHFMAFYKKGYICWASDTVFNPEGKDWKKMFIRRHGHKVKSGMKVKLKLKTADFPKVKHASFVKDASRLLSAPNPKFEEAIVEERQIYRNFVIERDRKGKRKK